MVQQLRAPALLPRLLVVAVLLIGLSICTQLINFNQALALGFSLDFLITIPLIYLLLIRKTSIPQITVVPLSVAMLLLANFLLPTESQQYLSLYQYYFLPVLELGVLVLIVLKFHKARKAFATASEKDIFFRLEQAALQVVNLARPARVMATEAAMFCYSLMAFRRPPAASTDFSYHRETGLAAIMGALMLLVVVETFAVHVLVMQWSVLAANVLTFLSLYSLLYLLSMVGAARHRQHVVGQQALVIRFGLQETIVPYQEIAQLQKFTAEVEEEPMLASLGILGNVNMQLEVKSPQLLHRLYGFQKKYKKLTFWVDNPAAFLEAVEKAQNNCK